MPHYGTMLDFGKWPLRRQFFARLKKVIMISVAICYRFPGRPIRHARRVAYTRQLRQYRPPWRCIWRARSKD